MKTILRIILILLVASLVAVAFSLAVNNNSITTSSSNPGQPPAMTGSNGQSLTRPEGDDHDSGSLAGGFAGVMGTVLKITGITILVVMLQKGWSQLGGMKWKSAQQ
jgi:hypothetical protein